MLAGIEDGFRRLLNELVQHTFGGVREGIDSSRLIDPLVSDTQCHIHAALLYSILRRGYGESSHLIVRDLSGFDVGRLSQGDKRLLGIACLLDSLKFSKEDGFGHKIYSCLTKALAPGIAAGRRKREKLITEAQREFNLASTGFIESSVGGKIKEILVNCQAELYCSGVGLRVLPCYAAMYGVIRYIEEEKLPIIISLTRIKREGSILALVSRDVFFYEFKEESREFSYKEQKGLSKDEKGRLAIAFFCFSLLDQGDKFNSYVDNGQLPSKKFLTEGCDIRNLLMVSAAGHIQLSKHSKLPDNGDTEKHVESLYKKSLSEGLKEKFSFNGKFDKIEENVSGAYNDHLELAKTLGMANAPYSEHETLKTKETRGMTNAPHSEDEHDNGSVSIKVTRRGQDTLFAIDHVSLSSYSDEKSRMERPGLSTKLDQIGIFQLNKKNTRGEVISKLQSLGGVQ